MQVVVALMQLVVAAGHVRLVVIAANRHSTSHLMHVPLRLLRRLRVRD